MGVARAAMQLGRFAAAEVHAPASRGRAISNVVIGGTVGSVLGPLMVGPAGQGALQAGMDELVGPFLAALIIFALLLRHAELAVIFALWVGVAAVLLALAGW